MVFFRKKNFIGVVKYRVTLGRSGPERTRTSDTQFRKLLFYPAELRDHTTKLLKKPEPLLILLFSFFQFTAMNRLYLLLFLATFLIACSKEEHQPVIEATGIIEATEILISSKVNSQIIDLRKDEGDRIEINDTLLVLDSDAFVYQLEQANETENFARLQLELMQKGARQEDIRLAEENFKQAEANFLLAKSNYEKFLRLKESQSISQKQFDEIENQFQIAKSRYTQATESLEKIKQLFRPEEIKQAEANLRKATANVKLLKKMLSDCFVVSPINGTIIKKFVEKGEVVAPGTPLLKLASTDTMEMKVYIPETELGKIKLGQEITIYTDSYSNKEYKGKVVFISNEAEFTPKNIQTKDERISLVFAVKLKLPNPNKELKAGMPADARIPIPK